MTIGTRGAGTGIGGLRTSFGGGIERAGATRAGRGGATCRVGMGDGTGTRGLKIVWWPVCLAGLAARARLTWVLALGLECLEDKAVLFLRLDGAFLECRAFPDEGFRDEDRADRGAFFLFKSFSLLESQAPSQALGNHSGTLIALSFYQREVFAPQRFFGDRPTNLVRVWLRSHFHQAAIFQ